MAKADIVNYVMDKTGKWYALVGLTIEVNEREVNSDISVHLVY